MNHIKYGGALLFVVTLLCIANWAYRAPAEIQFPVLWLCGVVGALAAVSSKMVLNTTWQRPVIAAGGIFSLFLMPYVWAFYGATDLVEPGLAIAVYSAFAWGGAAFAMLVAVKSATDIVKARSTLR